MQLVDGPVRIDQLLLVDRLMRVTIVDVLAIRTVACGSLFTHASFVSVGRRAADVVDLVLSCQGTAELVIDVRAGD